MVSIETFDWNSVLTLHKVPKGNTFVMIGIVAIVLIKYNLGLSVIVDKVISAVLFEGNVKKIHVKHLHVWDNSAVAAIDKVAMKYEQDGVRVNRIGLNEHI